MQMRSLLLTGILSCCRIMLPADSAPQLPISAVQAELLAEVRPHKLAVGASVFARVTKDWHGTGCILRRGAILEAHVISVVPYAKPEKIAEISLAFNKAQCSGQEMGSFDLLLVAVAAPPRELDLGVLTDPVPNPTPVSIGASAPADAGFRLISNAASMHLDTRVDFDRSASQFEAQSFRVGEVSGIHGLKLSVGTGAESSSVLSSKGHDLLLETHTLLVLIPMQAAYQQASAKSDATPPPESEPPVLNTPDSSTAAPAAESVPIPTPPPPPPVEQVEVCEPPQCNVALPTGSAINAGKPEATISIETLGYSPRPQKTMDSFDNDEALAWLGPHQLLVAFNPHTLMARRPLGPSGSTMRVIRVALVDTRTRQVTRTLDWELPDEGEYLWPLGDGTLLVHVASELRIYGENLQILKRVSLDGPLTFVSTSPDGKFIVAGVVHERHAPQLHEFLKQALETDPEEDISVLVLDRNLATVAQSTSHTGMLPPTLLNEGQARLEALPGMRYSISLLGWDNNTSTLAHFDSSCTPEFTSFPPDLILLVSCNRRNEGLREYRVLRPDGKLALKSAPNLTDFGHSAAGSANNEAFVVKTIQSASPVPPGGHFAAADFSSEDLAVYRASDSKRLLGVRVGAPTSSRDNYALAPNGSQLAVLTREQISVYSVPSK